MGRTLVVLFLFGLGLDLAPAQASSTCRSSVISGFGSSASGLRLSGTSRLRRVNSDDPLIDELARTLLPLLRLPSRGNESIIHSIPTKAAVMQFITGSKDSTIPTIESIGPEGLTQEQIDSVLFEILTWRASDLEDKHPLRTRIEVLLRYTNSHVTVKIVDKMLRRQIAAIRGYLKARRSN